MTACGDQALLSLRDHSEAARENWDDAKRAAERARRAYKNARRDYLGELTRRGICQLCIKHEQDCQCLPLGDA